MGARMVSELSHYQAEGPGMKPHGRDMILSECCTVRCHHSDADMVLPDHPRGLEDSMV